MIHENVYLTKEKESLLSMIEQELSHGSGIDCEWQLHMTTANRVIARNSYHCMDHNGMYDGYADFTLRFNLTDKDDFRLMFHGNHSQYKAKKYGLREYLEEILYEDLFDALFKPVEVKAPVKEFTVICQHCQKVLLDRGTEQVSHGDCFEYNPVPCATGKPYFIKLAKQMQMSYEDLLICLKKQPVNCNAQ